MARNFKIRIGVSPYASNPGADHLWRNANLYQRRAFVDYILHHHSGPLAALAITHQLLVGMVRKGVLSIGDARDILTGADRAHSANTAMSIDAARGFIKQLEEHCCSQWQDQRFWHRRNR